MRTTRASGTPFVRLLAGVGDERDVAIKRTALQVLGRWTLVLTAAGIACVLADLPATWVLGGMFVAQLALYTVGWALASRTH